MGEYIPETMLRLYAKRVGMIKEYGPEAIKGKYGLFNVDFDKSEQGLKLLVTSSAVPRECTPVKTQRTGADLKSRFGLKDDAANVFPLFCFKGVFCI